MSGSSSPWQYITILKSFTTYHIPQFEIKNVHEKDGHNIRCSGQWWKMSGNLVFGFIWSVEFSCYRDYNTHCGRLWRICYNKWWQDPFTNRTYMQILSRQLYGYYQRGTYWQVIAGDKCHGNTFTVLYEGPATVTRTSSYKNQTGSLINSVIKVENHETLFSFKLKSFHPLCHLDAYSTDHPRLIIAKKQGTGFYHKKKAMSSQSLDMFAYIN